MIDLRIYIQYHAPLEEEYQQLYHIADGLDYYHFIRLNANSDTDDPFIKSILYKDNTSDNISDKNYSYVDVTALYWYWKNVHCDIIGNNHYSKYFLNKNSNGLITKEEILDYLKEYDFITHIATLPGRTVYQIYKDFHGAETIDIAGKVIKETTPEYYKDFEDMLNGEDSTVFNMMIAQKYEFNRYCEWLFKILFKCEDYITVPDDGFQRKVYGFIGERLLLVWLKHNDMKYLGGSPFADSMKYMLEVISKNE